MYRVHYCPGARMGPANKIHSQSVSLHQSDCITRFSQSDIMGFPQSRISDSGFPSHIFTVRHYAMQYMLSSCPSIRLSVTPRYCTKTAKRTIMQTMPYDSPWTLVADAKDLGEIPMGLRPTWRHIEVE